MWRYMVTDMLKGKIHLKLWKVAIAEEKWN